MKKNDKWIPVSWEREAEFTNRGIDYITDRITIQRMRSPFYEGERYTVRRRSCCLTKDGKWELEPIPSSRDDAFYARCRFGSFDEAVGAIAKASK